MSHLDHTYVVLLAGGGGTRLWPKSRKKTPKQFLKLTGKESMIQVTASRITSFIPWERIIVVTNELHEEDVKKQLPELPVSNIIAEPDKKDTALAMLIGALYAKSLDPDAIVINQASDHTITDKREYISVMKAAALVAHQSEVIVTVGITPTFPSSGLGYIKIGEELESATKQLPVFKVESFTEKPNTATARAFISTGKYFWNANMYVWSATTIQKAFQSLMPETYELTKDLPNLKPTAFKKELKNIYEKSPAISIDYAVSEKAKNLVLIPGDFGWNDVGDWKVVYDLGVKDLAGNVITGDGDFVHTLTIDAQNNLIHANGRLIAVVGLEDMIIVDTDEILMIVPKSRSQDVKKIVSRLKEERKTEYL
ncbi:MAG: sugar phosphate nucleotidyltransferase [Microgenomates group bacterium]